MEFKKKQHNWKLDDEKRIELEGMINKSANFYKDNFLDKTYKIIDKQDNCITIKFKKEHFSHLIGLHYLTHCKPYPRQAYKASINSEFKKLKLKYSKNCYNNTERLDLEKLYWSILNGVRHLVHFDLEIFMDAHAHLPITEKPILTIKDSDKILINRDTNNDHMLFMGKTGEIRFPMSWFSYKKSKFNKFTNSQQTIKITEVTYE